MTYHITISVIHNNEIELLGLDSFYQFILHFISTHLRLQVVSSYFRRWNQDTLFGIIRSFTTTIEEESYVSILFCFCDVQLSLTVSSQVFTQCILNILLVEQNMNTFERCIIRSHAIKLQARNSMHTLFRHILLSQHNSQFLGTVVTVVEEDNHITFFDGTVYGRVIDRFDEFVCNTFIV